MSDGLYIEFPLWTIADAEHYEEHGLPGALVTLTDRTDGTKSVALFTDEDLAERFATNGPVGRTITLVCIESPASLREWLPDLINDGVTHVGLDTAAEAGQRGWHIPAADLLQLLPDER